MNAVDCIFLIKNKAAKFLHLKISITFAFPKKAGSSLFLVKMMEVARNVTTPERNKPE